MISYLIFFLIICGIYGIMTLGLNLQWGYTGLFNIGVAGFWAVGAYTSAILTKPPVPEHLGGFNLPFIVGILAAAVVSGIIAFLIGIPTLRLREDYLAIATIGIAEIIRLIVKNEEWLTNGVRGISGIPKPFHSLLGNAYNFFYLILVIVVLAIIYFIIQRGIQSPWGRVLRAIREDEEVATTAGKDVFRYRLESLILGAMIMGVGGAIYAHFTSFISPEAFKPMQGTFLVWVMLIIGGSGNSLGALLGALITWSIWSGTEILTSFLPSAITTQAAAFRVILIGVLLEVVLLTKPEGLLGEDPHVSSVLKE
ncbi:amino acid/amide ABC transporter membrane protein 2 (HAAT family) [Orenia metallireducens]|uniref:Amino acid/amide ABC transporter membrane protein 2, HAAT family n=1 Tax=Orenia metallireducens TaxID=1413210 RepID=A0A285HYM2_9FIRM|nr:branched-chain amino acid ABC transporter permease [Orenia metallireducens]PRX29293.1 amino acid/amide ABC transporter membrane protein 2 (HAAT family) [Orenia metallireducens]SNY40737.1 amino acid/amide ABC transporter membrane protein 2, HAAT family [Orenia metallireducens]